jgi:hypothetical protein
MLFNTYEFILLFAPASIVAFYLLRRFASARLAIASAVLASLAFYAHWRADYVPVLLASIAVNYALGSLILRAPGAPSPGRDRGWRRAQYRAAGLLQIHGLRRHAGQRSSRPGGCGPVRRHAARGVVLHVPADRLSGRLPSRQDARQ